MGIFSNFEPPKSPYNFEFSKIISYWVHKMIWVWLYVMMGQSVSEWVTFRKYVMD